MLKVDLGPVAAPHMPLQKYIRPGSQKW